jgi:hypothetical protein
MYNKHVLSYREQRIPMQFCLKLGQTASELCNMLREAFEVDGKVFFTLFLLVILCLGLFKPGLQVQSGNKIVVRLKVFLVTISKEDQRRFFRNAKKSMLITSVTQTGL